MQKSFNVDILKKAIKFRIIILKYLNFTFEKIFFKILNYFMKLYFLFIYYMRVAKKNIIMLENRFIVFQAILH